jgi:hypothetical protein
MISILGIDCATKDVKIGLALGSMSDGYAEVVDAVLCGPGRQAMSTLVSWIAECPKPVLLALDAPLGWPVALGGALKEHRAGEAIHTSPEQLFRRTTDLFIGAQHGKTPLDVGADRIARTAHSALRLIDDLRSALKADIPLAWDLEAMGSISAIEVYPAATLRAHGFRSDGYKKRGQLVERREIFDGLNRVLNIRPTADAVCRSADLLDAIVCVLAGVDFVNSMSPCPASRSVAEREGWIWCRGPRFSA